MASPSRRRASPACPTNHMSFDLPLPGFLHAAQPALLARRPAGRERGGFRDAPRRGARSADRRGRARNHRGLLRRAGDGRGRRDRAAGHLLGQDPGGAAPLRHPARRRRSDLRLRPHRQHVRLDHLRDRARRDDPVQAIVVVLPADLGHGDERESVRADRRRKPSHRHARHGLYGRRPSGGRGGGAGNAGIIEERELVDHVREVGPKMQAAPAGPGASIRWSARRAASG